MLNLVIFIKYSIWLRKSLLICVLILLIFSKMALSDITWEACLINSMCSRALGINKTWYKQQLEESILGIVTKIKDHYSSRPCPNSNSTYCYRQWLTLCQQTTNLVSLWGLGFRENPTPLIARSVGIRFKCDYPNVGFHTRKHSYTNSWYIFVFAETLRFP